MADFDYTYKGWDKIRPLTLAKTGLGDELKLLDKVTKGLPAAGPGLVDDYLEAKAQIDEVEKARVKAIAACGKNPLHQSARKALEKATPKKASEQLAAVFGRALLDSMGKIGEQTNELVERQTETLKLLKETIELTKAGKPVPRPAMVRTVTIIRGGINRLFVGLDSHALTLVVQVRQNESKLRDVDGKIIAACKQHHAKAELLQKRNSQISDLAHEAKALLKIK